MYEIGGKMKEEEVEPKKLIKHPLERWKEQNSFTDGKSGLRVQFFLEISIGWLNNSQFKRKPIDVH
jgi:hypothetical protein